MPLQSRSCNICRGVLADSLPEIIGKWLEQEHWAIAKKPDWPFFKFALGPWFLIKSTDDHGSQKVWDRYCGVVTCYVCGHRKRGGPFVWVLNYKFVNVEGWCLALALLHNAACSVQIYDVFFAAFKQDFAQVLQLYNMTLLGWRTIFWMTCSSFSSSSSTIP